MRNGSVLLFLTVAALAALCIAAPSGDSASVSESYPQGPCEAGSEVSYQCNTCTCTQDGSGYACTRQLCPPPERERRQAICTPGQRYPASDGCNTCICARDGKDLACTRKFCLSPVRERRQARCVPGRPYPSPDGCNTCTCTSTRVLACTRRLCLTGGPGIGPPLRG